MTSPLPGGVVFDSLPGADDSAKIASMNDLVRRRQVAGGPMPRIFFPDRVVRTRTPITLWSSLAMEALGGTPSREFTRRPGIRWEGGANGALFRFPTEAQSGQGYPSDGSPRDGSVIGLEFDLGGGDLIERAADYRGRTLWYWTWHNIGVKNGKSAWIGYSTGTSFGTGSSHFQAMTDTIIDVGGSETTLFGSQGYGFLDTSVVINKALIRSKLEKSFIGTLMPTGRKGNLPLELYGGGSVLVAGITPDSQESDPIYGCGIRISGGEGHVINGACVKGVGVDPARGPGGYGLNRGMIHISGGTQHVIMGTRFVKHSRMSPDFPVVYIGPGAGEIKLGLNAFRGWGNAQAVYQESRAGQIATLLPDWTSRLVTGG